MSEREEERARYVLIDVRRPLRENLEEDIEWFARCFGFLETRDVAKTAAGIFAALLYAAAEDGGLTSDELSEKIGVTRGAIVHHLNKMMGSGLVIFHGGRYKLRERSLRRTVEEIGRDVSRVLENIVEIASDIDEKLNLPYRGA
ncbi:MAG: ArsR family transcriptional regulator [Candidatus Bathyarchaeia archaeon]